MRILHVINDLCIGGTQHLLSRHVRELRERHPGLENIVCVLAGPRDACAEYRCMIGSPVHYLGFSGRYRRVFSSVRCIWRLRRVMKNVRPDIVHTYLWCSDLFTAFARVGLGLPQVASVVDRRADAGTSMTGILRRRLTRWVLRRCVRRFAAVSEACRVHALENYKLRPQQVVTAYNGVTVRPTRAPPRADHDGVVVVGTLSNLIEEKGHEDLLAAVHELKEQGVPVALRVAGSGRLRDRLEALSSALGLADRVEFLGSVTSTDGFYRTIDLFVVPSVAAEGLPTTILEAMAANLPVVATAIGGSVEAISDGKEGLIVPARDPGALAAAIGHLISNPDLRHEMGSNGRKTVERQFSIARMTDTIVRAVYEPSLAAAANGAPGGL